MNEFEKINISDELDNVVNTSMGKLRQERRREKIRHAAAGIGGTALMLGAAFIFCINNTALASKLPLIGHVFERMEKSSDYPAGLKENSVRLIEENEAQELDKIIDTAGNTPDSKTMSEGSGDENRKDEALKDNPYVKTSNGITVMISEFTYDKNSIYMGVTIKRDEPFPEGFKHSKYVEGYQLSYDRLGVSGIAELRDENGNKMEELEDYCVAIAPDEIRGTFIDDYTFSGIMAADFNGFKTPTEMPDNFTYNIKLHHIYCDDCLDLTTTTYNDPEYGEIELQNFAVTEYEGDWTFDIDISCNSDNLTVINVNETNENGEGIATVNKTPYVITADLIIPEDAKRYDYLVIICDANGDLLETAGNTVETYDVTGRDMDEAYIFLCEHDKYLGELKGYFFSDDYETKRETKTFAEYLREDYHCLYETKVSFK